MPTPALTAERGRAPAGADAPRGDSGGGEKADSTMIFTRLALAKKGKQAVNIRCRFACGIPPNWQYLCKLTPFTARWFRFNPTRRAKIRLGPMGLLRRASIGAEGSKKKKKKKKKRLNSSH